MEKIKTWWSEDGKWFCLLVDDGVNKATVSLTPEEAKGLARDADPGCAPYSKGCEARYIPGAICQSPECDCD